MAARSGGGCPGNFIVVWASGSQDGSDYGIFGQRFSPAGTPAGSEFQVNSYTTEMQYAPAIAADPAGNFVVVWSSYAQDGSEMGLFGQRFDALGVPVGTEFGVTSYTTGSQRNAAVAAAGNGDFVVVWDSYSLDGTTYDIVGQLFDAGGLPAGSSFKVNSYTTGYQRYPSVAVEEGGQVPGCLVERRPGRGRVWNLRPALRGDRGTGG